MARNLIGAGVDDEDAIVPELRDVGLLVADEVDVSGRGKACDTAHLLVGVDVDGKDDVRVINDNPPYAVADDHRLRHIAQLHRIRAVEELVLDLARGGIVERERGIAILEVALVGNEKTIGRVGE